MRVTIWQQFSSNHSAEFTLVGRFASPEKAQAAERELRTMVMTIDEWYSQSENHITYWDKNFYWNWRPSPIEIQIGEKYGVEFVGPVDWLWGTKSADRTIGIVGNLVMLTDRGWSKDAGPRPFDTILRRLGAEVTGGIGRILASLTCTAPNEETGAMIPKLVDTHLQEVRKKSRTTCPSWMCYWGGVLHPQADELLESWKTLIARWEAEEQWDEENVGLYLEEKEAHKSLKKDYDAYDAVRTRNRDLRRQAVDQLIPPHPLEKKVRDIRDDTSFTWKWKWIDETRIENNGLRLSFQDMLFQNLSMGLPALVAWLEAMGCKDIDYTYRDPNEGVLRSAPGDAI